MASAFSFGLRVASAREWTEAGIRLVTTRLLGGAPSFGDQGCWVVTTQTPKIAADG